VAWEWGARDSAVAHSSVARRWLASGKVRTRSTKRLPRGCWWKEGMVGSPRKRLDGWGRSGGGAAVFTGGGGAPVIGGGQLRLLQHRTHRGGEEWREIWVENPGRWSSPRGRDDGNGGPPSSRERSWHGRWRG
jgi:hypothetical protein